MSKTVHTGTCLCYGVFIEGHIAKSRPRPYLAHDIFGGKPVKVRLIVRPGGGVGHEIPVEGEDA